MHKLTLAELVEEIERRFKILDDQPLTDIETDIAVGGAMGAYQHLLDWIKERQGR